MKRKVVAITGGIGSGKSEVTSILRKLGYETVSCDELGKTVAAFPEVIKKVGILLGSDYVKDGQLNRKAIRQKVFADSELLAKYNAIFFGEIKRLLTERLQNVKATVFVEIPVFDAFAFDFDAVWLVEANVENRIERAVNRDGALRKNLEDIVNSQKICETYTCKIPNNGSLQDLETEVKKALHNI